jgi:hypothetical protein
VYNLIDPVRLEFAVRNHLDEVAHRAFAVLRPLKVVLTSVPEDGSWTVTAPDFPRKGDEAGTHAKPLCRVLYVERDDYRDVDSKDFYGLAPGKVKLSQRSCLHGIFTSIPLFCPGRGLAVCRLRARVGGGAQRVRGGV